MPSKTPDTFGFGFRPRESQHHFLVTLPKGKQRDVVISEHLSWDPERPAAAPTFALGELDGKLRCVLPRAKWDAIADALRVAFNTGLKKAGLRTASWKTGANPVARLYGKELVLLAWAIEDADPALIPIAIRNWQGLVPEERWWLYTMTCAATGHAVHGRNRGWRKAVRFALTENPVGDVDHAPPPAVFELKAREDAADYADGAQRRAASVP
jgi:hypothetical protein